MKFAVYIKMSAKDQQTFRSGLLISQKNRCMICGTLDKNQQYRLCVDHNHRTDEIRGLLCQGCNGGIGLFADSPLVLRRAIMYLKGKPAPILTDSLRKKE